MNDPDLVLYHAGCFDGFCAAWLVHRAYPNAEFCPVNYGQEPPDVDGRNVWIVDFSYKRPTLLKMNESAASLLVLDHHKTAKADLEGLDFCHFDMDKSGARMTFNYLCSIDAATGGVTSDGSWLVDYTEDRDLWRWKLPDSKEINAALRCYPMEFDVWDRLHVRNTFDLKHEGRAILSYQSKLIESHVRHAAEVEIMGHRVLCVNCTCADLTSEIAGELAKDRPFGVCWFESDKNERIYSLRSRDNGIDVSEIAKAHGGGGHKNAAGFTVAATGATGTFSNGQLNNDDEGDIRLAIAPDKANGIVRLDFGKPVAWLGFPQGQAMQLAEKIQYAARKL